MGHSAMILTGSAIAVAVEAGDIILSPFDPALVNPNSYNYHLDSKLKLHTGSVQDPFLPHLTEEIIIPESGYVFRPGVLYLGATIEVIGSRKYVPSLIGRSSIGRLGVFVQVSADLGNLGAVHKWTLEIVVCQQVRLYPGMRFGQVSFWEPTGEIPAYHGHFGAISEPHPSLPDAFS